MARARARPNRDWLRDLRGQDCGHPLHVRERRSTGDELVEDEAGAVEIGPLRRRRAEPLRRRILRRPEERAAGSRLPTDEQVRDPEIEDFRPTVASVLVR